MYLLRFPRIRRQAGTRRWGRAMRTMTIASAALCVAALLAATPSANAAPKTPVYQDPHAAIPARVEDLLRRMTLAEKIGQMDQIVTGRLRDTTSPANGDCKNSGGNNDPLQETCL